MSFKKYCPECLEEMKWITWRGTTKMQEYYWCYKCKKELEEIEQNRKENTNNFSWEHKYYD